MYARMSSYGIILRYEGARRVCTRILNDANILRVFVAYHIMSLRWLVLGAHTCCIIPVNLDTGTLRVVGFREV